MSAASRAAPTRRPDRLGALREDRRLLDAALLIVRTVLAWDFIFHGAGKLFGAFHGPGVHATALYFSSVAHLRPGGLFAVLGGIIEFFGGAGMLVGLAARLCGLALAGDMIVAMITVTWVNGINSEASPPGYELNLVLVALALVVVLLGAGRVSLDHLLGRLLDSRRGS